MCFILGWINTLAKIEGNSLPQVSSPFQVISVAHVLLLKSKLYFLGGASATITSSSENEERSASSEVLTKDEGLGGAACVMGHASEDCPPGLTRDNLTAQPDEALPRTDIMEQRTPPAPKRPLPQHHIRSTSSLVAPRPNSVAGMFLFFCCWGVYKKLYGFNNILTFWTIHVTFLTSVVHTFVYLMSCGSKLSNIRIKTGNNGLRQQFRATSASWVLLLSSCISRKSLLHKIVS